MICPLSTLRRRWRAARRQGDLHRVLYVLTHEHPEPVEFHQLCKLAHLSAERAERAIAALEIGPFIATSRLAPYDGCTLNEVREMVALTDTGWTTFNADVWRP